MEEIRSAPSTEKRRLPLGEAEFDAIKTEVRAVIALEAEAIARLVDSVDDSYRLALEIIASAPGKVVLTGVGKSGLIAKKIAATMTSTGTAAVFLHPADAMHGDLGVVTEHDVVIALGKSGESDDLIGILPAIRRIGAKIIAITAEPASRLARASDVTLWTPVEREACPLNLAPTVSTTLALVVGDALAVGLMKLKDFKPEQFAQFHPGGKLGKRLSLRVTDLLIPFEKCAVLDPAHSTMEDVILGLSEGGLGLVLFAASSQKLEGIITDGDIRRLLQKHRDQIFQLKVSDVMNQSPYCIHPDLMAVAALRFMEERPKPLNVVPVLDEDRIHGVLRLHELVAVS